MKNQHIRLSKILLFVLTTRYRFTVEPPFSHTVTAAKNSNAMLDCYVLAPPIENDRVAFLGREHIHFEICGRLISP